MVLAELLLCLNLPNDGHTDTNGGKLNGDHVNDDRPEEQC